LRWFSLTVGRLRISISTTYSVGGSDPIWLTRPPPEQDVLDSNCRQRALPNSSASAQITRLLKLGCIGGLLPRVLGVTPESILSLMPST
jgi:hypothetical protein